MFLQVLKSKLHNIKVTKTQLYYDVGSIGIDLSLLAEAGIVGGEFVYVLNYNTGQRFQTYTIEEDNPGEVVLYGPAARCGFVGDLLCVISYAFVTEQELAKLKPKIIFVDENNKLLRVEWRS